MKNNLFPIFLFFALTAASDKSVIDDNQVLVPFRLTSGLDLLRIPAILARRWEATPPSERQALVRNIAVSCMVLRRCYQVSTITGRCELVNEAAMYVGAYLVRHAVDEERITLWERVQRDAANFCNTIGSLFGRRESPPAPNTD